MNRLVHYCAYHSVAYFVFRKDTWLGTTEPILEVDDETNGQSLSRWLTENPFVSEMISMRANNNDDDYVSFR